MDNWNSTFIDLLASHYHVYTFDHGEWVKHGQRSTSFYEQFAATSWHGFWG